MRQQTTGSSSTPGASPAEGRSDLGLPGADHDDAIGQQPGRTPDPGMPDPNDQPSEAPETDLPERLGERIQDGPRGGIATGEPDLMPNVDVPEETM